MKKETEKFLMTHRLSMRGIVTIALIVIVGYTILNIAFPSVFPVLEG